MKALWNYLESLSKGGARPRSVDTYRKELGLFAEFLLRERKKDLLEADTEDVEAYLKKRKPVLSAWSFYNCFGRIRGLYRYLEKEGLISKNPAVPIKSIKTPSRESAA